MGVNEQISLILAGIENVRKANEPYKANIIKYKRYLDVLKLLNLLSDKIEDIYIDDVNKRLSDHMIIVTWKVNELGEMEFDKDEMDTIAQALELCDHFLVNNGSNDWTFFVTIYE